MSKAGSHWGRAQKTNPPKPEMIYTVFYLETLATDAIFVGEGHFIKRQFQRGRRQLVCPIRHTYIFRGFHGHPADSLHTYSPPVMRLFTFCPNGRGKLRAASTEYSGRCRFYLSFKASAQRGLAHPSCQTDHKKRPDPFDKSLRSRATFSIVTYTLHLTVNPGMTRWLIFLFETRYRPLRILFASADHHGAYARLPSREGTVSCRASN